MWRYICGFSALLGCLAACNPELPLYTVGADGGPLAPDFSVKLEPDAPLEEAPAALRLRIEEPPEGLVPERVLIATGVLGPAHLRQLQTSEVSMALSERILPLLSWREPDGAIVVAPQLLERGESYTLALADFAMSVAFTVSADAPEVLPRVWPPPGQSATNAFGVWCGDTKLPSFTTPMRLEPRGARGVFERGVEGAGESCVSFRAQAEGEAEETVPPPSLQAGSGRVSIDPRTFLVEAEPSPIPDLACDPDEDRFGPGCVRVLDDRLVGRSPAAPLLWAASGGPSTAVLQTSPGDPFVLTPFPAASDLLLHMSAFDTAGRAIRWTFAAKTKPAMPHVVINEVLANPLGAEPSQEWVEIVNTGSVPANLAGYVLLDPGGETALPETILPPGGFALLVGDAFLENDGFDVPPAGGTPLLRVPSLGKSGLSNEGEPLLLRDEAGNTVSSFPAGLVADPGASVARKTPKSADIPSSFVAGTPTPGLPNPE
jgi:hypothetical protein